MGQWKIGYLSGLDNMSTYEDGMEAYHPFGAKTLDLDTTKMCRASGSVSSVSSGSFSCTNIVNYPNVANTTATTSFETDEFNRGFVRILSGVAKGNVYRVTNTSGSVLTISGSTSGVTNNNRFEVVTGACTFEFPDGRNPTHQDFKRMIMNTSVRYAYYEGGVVIPQGWQPDDFMIRSTLTDARDADRLEVMLNHILDYKGMDGLYSIGGLNDNCKGFAPMIIETGLHYAQYQHLGNVVDYSIKKDATKSDDFYDVSIHLKGYNAPTYRGL